jgi:hypothetical protein
MENHNIDYQIPFTNQTFTNQSSQVPAQKNNNLVVIILNLVIIILIGVSAYLYGVSQGKMTNESQTTILPTVTIEPGATLKPTMTTQSDVSTLGETSISFTDTGTDIFIKHNINLSNNKVKYPNSELRIINNIYSQDKSLEPQEITNVEENKYIWTEITKEPIINFPNSVSISVWDRLFSFRKIPNTKSFLFVEEYNRDASQKNMGGSTYQNESVLWFYSRSQTSEKLTKIQSFSRIPIVKGSYTYPKIDTFSQDNRYVSLELFGCWGCGGHQPETFLFDLQTLKTKNLGKVLQFLWGQNGAFSYKDYIVIDCKEPQPGTCNQDPDSLPLKNGQL